MADATLEAVEAVKRLLDVEPGTEVAAGYVLETVGTAGTGLELGLVKAGVPFQVWIRPASDDSGCWRKTDHHLVGYRGEIPGQDAFDLMDAVFARLRKGEARPVRAEAPAEPPLVLCGEDLELRVTMKCNEKCPFCNSEEYADNVVLDPARAREAIEKAPAMGATAVVLTGGEPTLVPHLPSLVRLAHERKLEVTIQTNGLIPSRKEWWDTFGGPAGPSLPDALFVSFHTARPERVQALTGVGGTLPRKVQAVRLALDRGVHVFLNFVATTLNSDELPEFPGFVARTFGSAPTIELSVAAPNRRAAKNFHLVPRVADLGPRLGQALDAARAAAVWAEVPEVCGLPPCAVPEDRHREDFLAWHRESPVERLAADRRKGPDCERCAFNPRCIGIWKMYADAHGFDEFRPLAALPTPGRLPRGAGMAAEARTPG